MQKFLPLKAALAAAAALMLAGCPTTQGEPSADEAEEAAQASQRVVIDTVCVVRHQNKSLASDDLIKAIEAGVQTRGVKTRVVEAQNIPQDCRLCLYYDVTSEGKKMKSFDFQAVLDGKPLQRGSGAIEESGVIKLQTIANYAANYLQSLTTAPAQNAPADAQ